VRRIVALVLVALAVPPAAARATSLGVYGDAGHFRNVTGQRSLTRHYFPAWGRGPRVIGPAFVEYGPVPMIAIQTKGFGGTGEAITPLGIARGRGDDYLIELNEAAAAYGRKAYLRPLPEMNGHWNPYCAYNANGSKRGSAHSQAAFRDAFRRIYVILHGGDQPEMNETLRSYGMPGVGRSLPANPQIRVIWNPQSCGSPNVPRNMPRAYWPGSRFVDIVGNDLYRMPGGATWSANTRFFREHPDKPYAFPEWGLWGMDDPGFIRRMHRFVTHHRRVVLLAWYNGGAGSLFDLGTKPSSRRAYRRLITPLG
jgi:hypothetical protein